MVINNKCVLKYFLFGFIALSVNINVFGQDSDIEMQYNPNSIQMVPEYEQLYRVRVWRRLDLREKQNKGFFAYNHEITKLIMDGVKSGELDSIFVDNSDPYVAFPKEDYLSALTKRQGAPVNPYDAQVYYSTGEIVSYNGKIYSSIGADNMGFPPDQYVDDWWQETPTAGQAEMYTAQEVGALEIMEDIIFDKRRSTLYYDIQSIKLVIPKDMTDLGQELYAGTFKYKDLERFFRAHPKDARWVNRYNQKEWKNFADAILLRLFWAPIVKYENPDDLKITEMFTNHHDAVMEIYRFEDKMFEKEHNLWEY